jgi:hypothetical protein
LTSKRIGLGLVGGLQNSRVVRVHPGLTSWVNLDRTRSSNWSHKTVSQSQLA